MHGQLIDVFISQAISRAPFVFIIKGMVYYNEYTRWGGGFLPFFLFFPEAQPDLPFFKRQKWRGKLIPSVVLKNKKIDS